MSRGFSLSLYGLKKPKMSHAGRATGLSDQVSGILSPNAMLGILKVKLNYIKLNLGGAAGVGAQWENPTESQPT